MDHAEILEALGGYKRIAERLGLAPAVVWRWGQRRAIPPRRWPYFVEAARQAGVPSITIETLFAGYYPARQVADKQRLAVLEHRNKSRAECPV